MPNFLSTLKTVARSRLLRHNNVKPFIRHRSRTFDAGEIGNYVPVRCMSSIAGIDCFSSRNLIHRPTNSFNFSENLQKRGFMGVGDGEEGNALSKVHEENIIIG